VYSQKIDTKNKLLFTLRTTVPTVLLIVLLAAVIFLERRSLLYNALILVAGIVASVYFLYYMFFSNIREKIVDDITQTFNRNYFFDLLKKYSGDNLLIISIDNIKEINERYGIENGDAILRKFAHHIDLFFKERLQKELPISRFKSGDFLVILPKEADVKKLTKEFLNLYDNAFINNIEIKLYAASTKIESDPKKVIDHLYEELHYCFGECTKERKTKPKKREQFDSIIAKIIEEERIHLLFQPALNLKENRYDLAEVIVKLKDEEENIIHPSQYIPVINRMGLENRFDLVMAKRLLETIKEYHLPSIRYSFNISPFSIRNKNFTKSFFNLFNRCSITPQHFVLELYESSVYKDIDYYKKILDLYRQRGFLLAFDNFGACNASIEYVKRIDVDFVYFDKFFTKNVQKSRFEIFLRHWISLLHDMGIKSVIKFIDDESKIERFVDLGADYIEGFAVASPMEAQEFKSFLKEDHEIR